MKGIGETPQSASFVFDWGRRAFCVLREREIRAEKILLINCKLHICPSI
jgi:hypothetical protein